VRTLANPPDPTPENPKNPKNGENNNSVSEKTQKMDPLGTVPVHQFGPLFQTLVEPCFQTPPKDPSRDGTGITQSRYGIAIVWTSPPSRGPPLWSFLRVLPIGPGLED